MSGRQILPTRWLIFTDRNRAEVVRLARKCPLGSGVLVLVPLSKGDARRLRQVAIARRLLVLKERPGIAWRVHNLDELRAALSAKTQLILLSPLFPTPTHPDWPALPRMRAAALARLARRRLIALGGMDERRYRKVARLGFNGWAGVSAFKT